MAIKDPQYKLISPNWWAINLEPRDQIPGGSKLDMSTALATDGLIVTVGTGGAAIGATSVPLATAIPENMRIPVNTILYFGGVKIAQLTAEAIAGATALTVTALPTALVANDVATYQGTGAKTIPSGTLLGRTFSDRNTALPFKVTTAANVATLEEFYLLAFDVISMEAIADCTLTRPGFVVKENWLPNWATMGATVQAKIRQIYTCTLGV